MPQCSQNVYEGVKRNFSVSLVPYPSQKLSKTGHPNLQVAFHSRTIYHSQVIPTPSMVPSSPICQFHTQLTLTILHNPKTIWVCTTAWRIQIRRHATSPACYTSKHILKANCERHMRIPLSKEMVYQSISESLSVPSRLCHQNKRRTRLRLY